MPLPPPINKPLLGYCCEVDLTVEHPHGQRLILEATEELGRKHVTCAPGHGLVEVEVRFKRWVIEPDVEQR